MKNLSSYYLAIFRSRYLAILLSGYLTILPSCGGGGGGSADDDNGNTNDTTAPTVTTISPSDGSVDASTTGNITITFSEELDEATVTSDTITVKDLRGSAVTGTLSYDTQVVTFTPSGRLLLASAYTVTILSGDAGVTDAAGNAIASDLTYSFTTTDGSIGDAEDISTDEASARGPMVASDPSGNVIAVWYQSDGSVNNIWANRYDAATGQWGTPETIETGSGYAWLPQVSVNANGDAAAVWFQADDSINNIYANIYSDGWGTATLIETNSGVSLYPDIAIDNSGNIMAVWIGLGDDGRYNSYANRYTPAGGWGTPELLESNWNNVVYDATATTSIVADDSGNFIAAWRQSNGTYNNLVINRYVSGVGWGSATIISDATSNVDSNTYNLAIDSDGDALAVWSQTNNVFYSIFDSLAGTWSAAALLESADGAAALSAVAMNSYGNGIAVWQQLDGSTYSLYAKMYDPDTGFGDAEAIETNIAAPVISPVATIDAAGNASVVWRETSGAFVNQYFIRYTAADGWGTAENFSSYLGSNDAADATVDGRGIITIVYPFSSASKDGIYANRFE